MYKKIQSVYDESLYSNSHSAFKYFELDSNIEPVHNQINK